MHQYARNSKYINLILSEDSQVSHFPSSAMPKSDLVSRGVGDRRHSRQTIAAAALLSTTFIPQGIKYNNTNIMDCIRGEQCGSLFTWITMLRFTSNWSSLALSPAFTRARFAFPPPPSLDPSLFATPLFHHKNVSFANL